MRKAARRFAELWRTRRAAALFLALSAAFTGAAVLLLVFGVPTVQKQKDWFWPIRRTGNLEVGLFAVAAFALPYVIRLVARPGRSGLGWSVAALILWGTAFQHGLACSEKRDLDGMRDRMVATGHSEFAKTAARERNAWRVLLKYEDLVRAGDQKYARSKPPGQLLFYIGMADVAETVMPLLGDPLAETREARRHARLLAFATLFFPLLSYAVLIPLAYLGAVFLGRERALWPPFLYVLFPPTALVTLHLDQVLYPTLAGTVLALSVRAVLAKQRAWAWWIGAGAALWLALFVSFSLLPLVPLAALFAWAAAIHSGGVARPEAWRRLLAGAAVAVSTFALLWLLFRLAAGYDPIRAWNRAMEHHKRWKRWKDEMRWRAFGLDLSEFAYWLGFPALAAFVWQAARGARDVLRRRLGWDAVVTLGVLGVLLFTAITGRTLAEVARLWIFFLVPFAVVCAHRLAAIPGLGAGATLTWVAILQVGWTFALKAMQDFK